MFLDLIRTPEANTPSLCFRSNPSLGTTGVVVIVPVAMIK